MFGQEQVEPSFRIRASRRFLSSRHDNGISDQFTEINKNFSTPSPYVLPAVAVSSTGVLFNEARNPTIEILPSRRFIVCSGVMDYATSLELIELAKGGPR